jgi:hypothetical protein
VRRSKTIGMPRTDKHLPPPLSQRPLPSQPKELPPPKDRYQQLSGAHNEPLSLLQPTKNSPEQQLSTSQPSARRPDYYSLSLRAPSNPFSHERASDLFKECWSLQKPFLASHIATHTDLDTEITVAAGTELAFSSRLYAVMGDLDITPRPAMLERRQLPTLVSISGMRSEDLESLPMRDIAENGRHDPTNSILEAFYAGGMEEGERVESHLFCKPAFSERIEKTYNASMATGYAWFIFPYQYPKYPERVHDEILERLNQYGFDITSIIAVSGPDKDRLYQKAHAISAAFSSRTTNTGSAIRQFAYGITHDDWQYRSSFSLNDIDLKDRVGTYMTTSEAANLFSIPSEQSSLPTINRLKLPPVALSPSMLKADGITIGTYHYRGKDYDVHLPFSDIQRGPTVDIGKTGQSKTNLAKQIMADIIRNHNHPKVSVFFYDPHRDESEDIIARAIPEDQIDNTYYIDFGDTSYPPGLPLLHCPEGVSLDDFIPDAFKSIKLLFAENWVEGSRMETVAYSTIAALCHLPNASLRDIPRLYTDQAFRTQTLSHVKNQSILEFFQSYEQMSDAAQRELVSPVTNRLTKLYRSEVIRNITCRSDGIDEAKLANERAIVGITTDGQAISDEAPILIEIMVARMHLAMLSRSRIPQDQRVPTLMVLDESQEIKGAALPKLLSQDRKFGMIPILLTQFLGNWSSRVEEAVIGNNANFITFALGPKDARILAPMLHPYTAQQIMDLDRHQAIAKISVNGVTSPAFHMTTKKLDGEPNYELVERAKENARRRFGKPRAELDKLFARPPDRPPHSGPGMEMFDVGPTA